ncbi:branched-chain amino acid transport system substrate-binding protein [Rhodoligotrophos appendicifer]|uniref:branched-chain amino acid ABC transporter substrate-binding protein n=1 Tax=Rhodoligotrophos appendicifer TaxID=987056 RepID=UPI001FE6A6E5|nr:branched-chain amino acid ABC transporter substrate-binding protein [Rhodoligotrophos appendicifer]
MVRGLSYGISAIAAAAVFSFGAMTAHAETKGPVTDDLGVVMVEKGAPITIGGYWVISGPDTALGLDSQRGAEIAFDDLGNKIAGHDVQLVVEDDACGAEGGQTAATKLASLPNIVAVIGPACSSAATTAAPILWKQGISNVGTATTAPSLTAPDRKPDYQGFLRTIYSDAEQGKNDAEYFFNELQCKTLATIHDGSPYASQLAAAAGNRFKELGGQVVAEEAVTPTDVDMRPVLTGIGTKKPCVLYFPTFVAASAQILRQVPDVPDLKDTKIIGGSAVMAPGMLEAAGDSAEGFVITNVDISPEAMGQKYPDFVKKYTDKYGEAPVNAFHAQAYDAGMMLAKAIESVAKTDADGNTYIGKKALNEALYATKGMDGISGPINCDAHGQCGGFNFAVYEFTDSDPSTFKVGENPKRIFPKN